MSVFPATKDETFEALMTALTMKAYDTAYIYLAHADIDLNRHDFETGDTPLTLAVRTNEKGLIAKLIEKGARHDFVDRHDFYPLYLAAESNAFHAIEELVKAGADINRIDKFGHTALMAAASAGAHLALMKLSMLGADPFIQDHDRKTAKDHAYDNGQTTAILIIQAIEEKILRDTERQRQQTLHENARETLGTPPFRFKLRR